MPLTMFDDVRLSLIPKDAPAVASYVNGRYANHMQALAMFPRAEHLSIAVTSHADADCLDVEPGDAPNGVAAAWVKRQQARGVHRPVVYTSLSNATPLLKTLYAAGLSRSQIRLWTAHYTGREHRCGPACGFGLQTAADATQWTDRALNRSLDRSLCRDDFFHAAPMPVPVPAPKPPPRIVRGYRIARHLIGGVWYTAVERVFGQAK